MIRTASLAVSLLLCVCFLSCAQAQAPQAPAVPDGILYEPDIVFGKGGEVDLQLDLARPEKAAGPLPCIVVIHGGGWRGGDRKMHIPQIFEFAKRNCVSVTIQYRLVPKARFPSQIEDVKCAVRYLRANSQKYNIDPDRFGAIGFSAGAHLSMLLGTMDKADGLEGKGGHPDQSSKVQAVVAYFGPTDLSAEDFPGIVTGMINDFLGSTPEENPGIRKQASPITYVDKADAPMLLLQGTKDPLVPHSQVFRMVDAMTKAGQPGRAELLLGAGHGWGGTDGVRTGLEAFAFFGEHLAAKK